MTGMTKNKKPRARQKDTLGTRITKRLEAVGKAASTASLLSGNGEDFIRNILRKEAAGKSHVPRADKLAALAQQLATTPEWLLTGRGIEDLDEIPEGTAHIDSEAILPNRERPTVPVSGYVSAGAQAIFIPLPAGELDRVVAPPNATDQTIALEIRGESLGEMFDRWLVFYDEVRSPVTPDMIGKVCVVGLPDGRILVKKVKRARDGLYDLLSNNAEPIRSVAIEWAARVKHMGPHE